MKRISQIALCAAALVFALALGACGSSPASSGGSSSAGSSAAEASSASAASASASAASASASAASSASASEAASASSASAASSGQAAGFDFVDECVDEHQNATLYALTELKGWQLETLLDQLGYEWDSQNNTWLRMVDGASFSAYKQTGVYTQETYNEMNQKGGAIVAVGFHVVAGYKDAEAALAGNAKCVVEDSYFADGEGIAIFYGPSMEEYLAIISPYTESTTLFTIFSKQAVGSGMADELLGTTVGGSFNDVWKTVTGQDSYGH